MATADRRPPFSLDIKKKETKKKKNNEDDRSMPEKNKMGREIEEIFRANKKKRKESPGVAGQSSAKARVGTGKEDKKVNKKKVVKDDMEKKKNGFPVDESSENRSKRRRTADGFAIYSAEELGIGNTDAGNTPLCPFDCSCCF
ncbi:hypothetical protein M5K25_012519 [Dendrobium thyrsiflorum]|uniref:DUF1764 domain-containing protein n=1 Tax=Dendrobium thyrsiflorum TaxID=117978 RepID=A0ABD0V440_DENTH